jgi:hypothetical protein
MITNEKFDKFPIRCSEYVNNNSCPHYPSVKQMNENSDELIEFNKNLDLQAQNNEFRKERIGMI